ncbi:MAG: hypothetical protein M2R45_01710 [Verrucomicrobia subdivision 3 bacterium]|nr:hypothetical protein [Limisphaerales bacterium]
MRYGKFLPLEPNRRLTVQSYRKYHSQKDKQVLVKFVAETSAMSPISDTTWTVVVGHGMRPLPGEPIPNSGSPLVK